MMSENVHESARENKCLQQCFNEWQFNTKKRNKQPSIHCGVAITTDSWFGVIGGVHLYHLRDFKCCQDPGLRLCVIILLYLVKAGAHSNVLNVCYQICIDWGLLFSALKAFSLQLTNKHTHTNKKQKKQWKPHVYSALPAWCLSEPAAVIMGVESSSLYDDTNTTWSNHSLGGAGSTQLKHHYLATYWR